MLAHRLRVFLGELEILPECSHATKVLAACVKGRSRLAVRRGASQVR